MNEKTGCAIIVFALLIFLTFEAAPASPTWPRDADAMSKWLFPIFGAVLIGGTASLITMNIQYRRDPSPRFNEDYHKSLPGLYTPAEVSYLLGNGKIGAEAIMSTIFDLVRKRCLQIVPEEVYEKSTILFGGKVVGKYRLMISERPKNIELHPHEEFLMKWFLEDLAGSDGLIMDDLKEMVKHRYDASKFQENLRIFTKAVGDLLRRRNLFTSTDLSGGHFYWFIASGLFFTAVIATVMFKAWIFGASAIILALLHPVNLLAFKNKSRFTKEGIDQVAKWKAFRRFLLHFSDMEDSDMPSIATFELYLVYAVSLGVAKELLEQLSLSFGEEKLKDPSLSCLGKDDAFKTFELTVNMLNRTLDSLHSAVQLSSGRAPKLPV